MHKKEKGGSNSCCGPGPHVTCDTILWCPITSTVYYSSITDEEAEAYIHEFIWAKVIQLEVAEKEFKFSPDYKDQNSSTYAAFNTTALSKCKIISDY